MPRDAIPTGSSPYRIGHVEPAAMLLVLFCRGARRAARPARRAGDPALAQCRRAEERHESAARREDHPHPRAPIEPWFATRAPAAREPAELLARRAERSGPCGRRA